MNDVMYENDRTIFKLLNPFNNDKLSILGNSDLQELLFYLDRYYLEYRELLNIDSNISFGIELEIEQFAVSVYDYYLVQQKLDKIVLNDRWLMKNDISLVSGREIASDVLYNNVKTWKDIKNVCNFISQYGIIGDKCATQVHVGSQILGNNSLYWYRFFKLWSIYENVVYRFCYGEYLTHRSQIDFYAKPSALFYDSRLSVMEQKLDSDLINMLFSIKPRSMDVEELKKFGISYWHMLADNDYNLFEDFSKFNYGCTVELRCPNGTYNPIVLQMEILFIIRFMEYCKSDKFDDNILNRRKMEVEGLFSDLWAYSRIYLNQALELCDMIFDNNLDKVYFLRQYLKSFEVSDKMFVKAKKFTSY